MAAKRFRSLLTCAIFGHKWGWRGNEAPYRCHRCNQYEDAPHIVRASRRRAWLRKWSPVWPSFVKHGASLRIGWAYRPFTACVMLRAHWHAERAGELPGLTAGFDVWRLHVAAGVGGGWQDEDAEGRGFFYLTGRFKTYGLRWIGCWFGHKPQPSEWNPKHVYCARCDEFLTDVRESVEPKVAA